MRFYILRTRLAATKLEEIIITAFHETRHVDQRVEIGGNANIKHKESMEIVDTYKNELERYYRPNEQRQEDPRYPDQELEKDAQKFAVTI